MEKVELNINFALSLICDMLDYDRSMFSHIYPFSTENIKGYYDLIDFKDKDILTVGSSGDHTINLFLKDIKNVDFFDINPFSKYYYDLKMSAIKTLDFEEFFEYFCFYGYPSLFKSNYKAFNLESYKKIRDVLTGTSKHFWDFLYEEVGDIYIRDSSLFSKDEEPVKIIKKTNLYLQEDNYEKLKKQNIKNVNFYKSDIADLPEKINKKYDIIMLSNIFQYLEVMYESDYFEVMKEIVEDISNMLNDDGKILVCYMYGIDDAYDKMKVPIIYNLEEVKKTFNNLEILKFRGISDLKYGYQREDRDGILVYKKTKK